MEYDYPLLEKVSAHYRVHDTDVSEYHLYSCMHLLGPQLEMYKMFIRFGFKPENIVALGKTYSANEEIIQELRTLGIHVPELIFTGKSFEIEHTQNCSILAEQIHDNVPNIVLDDGGYLINATRNANVQFAIEQTSSGFRKLDGNPPNFPIFNVARSKTKLTQESPIIARQVFERSMEYAENAHIPQPTVAVIGLGPIGNSVYQVFEAKEFSIQGFDVETSKAEVIAYLQNARPDLVIGATGTNLLNEDDIRTLENDHTYHFISVSSSDREFPVSSFRNGEQVHEDVFYKNFVFVNNGFPITFKGLRDELTPVEIEKTIALLMGSVFHGVINRSNQQRGFVDVPSELEELINA